nr:unnamed protein product [Digitaria exilis]
MVTNKHEWPGHRDLTVVGPGVSLCADEEDRQAPPAVFSGRLAIFVHPSSADHPFLRIKAPPSPRLHIIRAACDGSQYPIAAALAPLRRLRWATRETVTRFSLLGFTPSTDCASSYTALNQEEDGWGRRLFEGSVLFGGDEQVAGNSRG